MANLFFMISLNMLLILYSDDNLHLMFENLCGRKFVGIEGVIKVYV